MCDAARLGWLGCCGSDGEAWLVADFTRRDQSEGPQMKPSRHGTRAAVREGRFPPEVPIRRATVLEDISDDGLLATLRWSSLESLRSLLTLNRRFSSLAHATMRSAAWLHDAQNENVYPMLWSEGEGHNSRPLQARVGPFLCSDSVRVVSRHASRIFALGAMGEVVLADVDAIPPSVHTFDVEGELFNGTCCEDGKRLAVVYYDATKVYDVWSGQEVWALPEESSSAARKPWDARGVAWTAQSQLLMLATPPGDDDDFAEAIRESEGTLTLWEATGSSKRTATPTLVRSAALPAHPHPEGARYEMDDCLLVHGSSAVVASATGTAMYVFALPSLHLSHMIDLSAPNEVCREGWTPALSCVPACGNGRLALGRSDGVAHVWRLDVSAAEREATEKYLDVHGGDEPPAKADRHVRVAALAIDGNMLATSHGPFSGIVQLFQIEPICWLRTLTFEDDMPPDPPFVGFASYFGMHLVLDGSRLVCTVSSEREERVNKRELWGDWLVVYDAHDVYHARV